MNDTIRTGAIAGLLGTAGDALIHIPAWFILGTSTTAHYVSQLVFPHKPPTLYTLTIGEIIHFSAGALIGILLILAFKYLSSDYALLKGAGLGMITWILHVVIIPNLVSPRPYVYRTELEVIVDLAAHLSYGLLTALYLVHTLKRKPVTL